MADTLKIYGVNYTGVRGIKAFDTNNNVVTFTRSGGGEGLTEEVKQALLSIAENAAYVNDNGEYYQALYDALYPTRALESISAVYTQSGTVYPTTSLDALKEDLVVTALYSDSSTETVTTYTLSGTLTIGTSTITITYSGKTTTFEVTVSSLVPTEYQEVEYLQSTGDEYIDTGLTGDLDTEVEIKLLRITAASTTVRMFGDRTAANNRAVFMSTLNSGIYVGFGSHDTNSSAAGGNPWDFTNPQTVIWNKTNYSINGTTKNYNAGSTPSTFTTPNTMTIFNARQAGSYGTGMSAKLYYIIVRESGTEVFHGIPCYRKADDVPGLYDTVTSTFFTNDSGSGGFTVGGDV